MNGKPEVLIVGAGWAGLACGKRLADCGVPFRIIESADASGGRYRTDEVEGFRLDRAFPLFLPAFPEVRRVFELELLKPNPLPRALLVRFGGRFHRLADPTSEPAAFLKALDSPLGTLRDKFRLLRFLSESMGGRKGLLDSEPERLALDLLRWNGRFSPALIDRLFRPLCGLFLNDRRLAVSSRLFRLLLRVLMEGGFAMPAMGWQQFTDQLAGRLPADSIRLGTKVSRIGMREAILDCGEAIRARAVVIATGAEAARELTGGDLAEAPSREGLLFHFAADRPPLAEPILALDGDGTGPVNHLVHQTNEQGESLISAGVVGLLADEGVAESLADEADLDHRVRLQMAEWFGAAASSWRLLRVCRTSLPDQAAGQLDPWQKPVRIHPGLYVCGMHRDQATMDGALTSGFRAAQAVMEDLDNGRT